VCVRFTVYRLAIIKCQALKRFVPIIKTNVNFLRRVFLISALKKSQKIINEIRVSGLVLGLQDFKVDLFALKLL
jgi:hypothetical protein